MKRPFVIFAWLIFIVYSSHSQLPTPNVDINKTIGQNEELKIPISENLQRIEINFHNVVDKESVAFWTSFQNDIENPENKIGPKKYRTITLSPKVYKENEAIRLDKKTIVLNTNMADMIVIHVEKGKVNIQANPPKKRMQ